MRVPRVDQQAANADATLRGANTLRDFGIDFQTATGRKHHARLGRLTRKGQRHGDRLYLAGVIEVFFFPDLFEILSVVIG